MSKVLVTGCAGLLGSHFTRYLLDKGHEVVGIDDLSGGYIENLDPRIDFYERNLVNQEQIDKIFKETKPEYVYHFAAYAAVGLSPFIRNFNYTNNVVASANIINGCVKYDVKKIVFTSSMDVYGSVCQPPYTEEMLPNPEDPYGIAKYAVEMDLKQACRFFGLRYSIVRPHNVFGVYQNIWDKYRNVLGIWIRQTLSGQPLTIYGDGSQVRSFSDIKFYMEPFEKLMRLGDGQIYNIGADTEISILDASNKVSLIAKKLGYDSHVVHLEPRDEVKSAYCDHSKAKEQLGFKDDTNFEDLIEKMFVWASSQPQRPVKMVDYEVDKKMYSFWQK
jgi:UDP-glucose 4-epimerase